MNPGAFLAASVIFSPVLGFLPGLAALLLTENVPKPVITTLSPFFRESRIPFSIAETASDEAFESEQEIKSDLETTRHEVPAEEQNEAELEEEKREGPWKVVKDPSGSENRGENE